MGTFPPGNGLSGALWGGFMKPSPYGPFPYSPIIRRPPLEWPDDARVALWVVPNIEFFSLETRPGGLGPGKIPDIPIWAMRDYGNRVGVFRLMEVLDRYGVRATVALNSDICVHCEYVADWGPNDDQPYAMTLGGDKTITSLPYSYNINDKQAFENANMTPADFQ